MAENIINEDFDIDQLKFDEKGLIPAVVIEAGTHKLLMVAWMNKESLRISMEKKLTCFWSRSRQELWLKGDTSGNYQHIVSITADCDLDTLEAVRSFQRKYEVGPTGERAGEVDRETLNKLQEKLEG